MPIPPRSVLFVLLFVTSAAFPQYSGGEFEILKNTLDSSSSCFGGEFSLTGTTGQTDAGPEESEGGTFSFRGGFWGIFSDLIFKDGFEQSS